MSIEMKALKSILAIKGLELPENVGGLNPVAEFIYEQFMDRLPDNEMVTILRDLFVYRANEQPMEVLQAIHQFNVAIVEFGQKEETKEYIKELNADPN